MTRTIDSSVIDELKGSCDLVSLIMRDVILKRSGREWVGPSPFTCGISISQHGIAFLLTTYSAKISVDFV